MTEELRIFKEHFEGVTDIKVERVIEEMTYPHWKRLVLPPLDANDLENIADYLTLTFRTCRSFDSRFTHLLPKIQSYKDNLVLTIDIKLIKEFLM